MSIEDTFNASLLPVSASAFAPRPRKSITDLITIRSLPPEPPPPAAQSFSRLAGDCTTVMAAETMLISVI